MEESSSLGRKEYHTLLCAPLCHISPWVLGIESWSFVLIHNNITEDSEDERKKPAQSIQLWGDRVEVSSFYTYSLYISIAAPCGLFYSPGSWATGLEVAIVILSLSYSSKTWGTVSVTFPLVSWSGLWIQNTDLLVSFDPGSQLIKILADYLFPYVKEKVLANQLLNTWYLLELVLGRKIPVQSK